VWYSIFFSDIICSVGKSCNTACDRTMDTGEVPPTVAKDGIFEDFPFKQRRHYEDHPSTRDAIALGMDLVGDEVPQLSHINRDDRMHKSKVVLGSEAGVPAPTMAQSEDPHFLSSYQMQCMQSRHQDDVGVIKKTRGKKIITPAYAQAGRNMGVVGDPFQDNTMKSALGLEHPMSAVGSLKQATGHLPGYSGHVPRSGDHVVRTTTSTTSLLS